MSNNYNQTAGLINKATVMWTKFISNLFIIFALTATLSNFLQGLFNFNLLPIFEYSLNGFQLFVNTITEVLFFYPLIAIVEYVFQLVFSVSLDIQPPNWLNNLCLISVVLLRADAFLAVNFKDPEIDSLNLDENIYLDQEISDLRNKKFGMISGLLRGVFEFVFVFTYPVAQWLADIFSFPFSKFKFSDFLWEVFYVWFGGMLMLGITKFINNSLDYFVIGPNDNIIITYWRKHYRNFIFIILISILSSFIFFTVNGFLV
jgi:hypothetical protein